MVNIDRTPANTRFEQTIKLILDKIKGERKTYDNVCAQTKVPNFPTLLLFAWLLFLTACQAEGFEPPRVVTQTAQIKATSTASPTPLLFKAPTSTPAPNGTRSVNGASRTERTGEPITLWVNEISENHAEALNEIAAEFEVNSGTHVEIVLVTPSLLPELVQTATISGTLPDLILHPVEYSHGWVKDGILDAGAATLALNHLERDTFDPEALDILTIEPDDDEIAALPSDGWQQLIIYRADWFEDLGLNPPESYEALLSAAEAIFDPEGFRSGLVVPTDATLITTQQVFEHVAAANGCELADTNGKISLLHPACLEALEYYRLLVNEYSPIGFQTDTSAINAYLSGRTGVIIVSPEILPILAGLDDVYKPNCPACNTPDYLVQNSGFVTEFKGNGDFAEEANFGEVTALGITTVADQKLATEFVNYWFNEAYLDWLAINPERKVPLRQGTPEKPTLYLDSWGNLPLKSGNIGLADIYGQELIERLSRNIASASRWGFDKNQGALVTMIYQDLIFSPLIQEMLSGYLTSSQTVVEMYRAAVELIPNYPFPIEIAPTQTPDNT